MRPNSLIIIFLLLLGGCATQPYGSFIQNPSTIYSKVMADEVTAQIVRLYRAANTQFNLRHAVNDPFGHALIENLRLEGFAVQERINSDNSLFVSRILMGDSIPDIAINHETDGASQPARLALSYIIDQSGDLYHVNITIDDTRLSRAFVAQADSVHPAGLWVRKE
ncbi:conjugative transfer protein TrbH [Nitrosomonas sp. Nm84]|uniref:conjugal transfer protein TrbH n=2 Tax=unclassified Nitrosomonas TaxID=2609265 RepID=UPI0001B132F8|nr:conjugal transfer protein TrbH [Nitrosomonas sp. Nm84]PXW85813.1 conjugative transfer protein TrbH [Nitrosomonas sp. Nm84]